MKKIPLCSLTFLCLASLVTFPALGARVEVTFSGAVTELSGGPVPAGVALGSPVQGRFVYESDAPTLTFDTDGVTHAGYIAQQGAFNAMSISVNGVPLADRTNDVLYIFTARNYLQNGSYTNYLQLNGYSPPGPGISFAAEADPSATPEAGTLLGTIAIPTSEQDIDLAFVDRMYGSYRADITTSDPASFSLRFSVDMSTFTMGPPNTAPVAFAGLSRLGVPENSVVELDGTGSYDPDGDALTYQWRQTGGPPVVLNNATSAIATFTAPFVAQKSGVVLAFELVVRDDDPVNPLSSLPSTTTLGIDSINSPPRCDLATPSIASLWPNDGRMNPVSIVGITDDGASGLPVTVRITGVRQDEPTSGLTGGDPSPDAIIVAGTSADTVQLRRERSAKGNGRMYTISFTAHDGWEGCSGSVKVGVPMKKGSAAVDDGPLYDSTSP